MERGSVRRPRSSTRSPREEPNRWETEIYSPRPGTSLLIATPLMVDGVLYVSTPLYQAAAVDARTGQTLWVYDPKAYASGTPAVIPWRHRGVAYWSHGDDTRIVWATGDRLPDRRRREDRPAGGGVRRGRARRSHGGDSAREPGLAERTESAGAVVPVTAARAPGHDHRRVVDDRHGHHAGEAARLGARLRRRHRPAQVGLPHHSAERR